MKYQQFCKLRDELRRESFIATNDDPLRVGLERAIFKKLQTTRLLAAAETCASETVKALVSSLGMQIQKYENAAAQFRQLIREDTNERSFLNSLEEKVSTAEIIDSRAAGRKGRTGAWGITTRPTFTPGNSHIAASSSTNPP